MLGRLVEHHRPRSVGHSRGAAELVGNRRSNGRSRTGRLVASLVDDLFVCAIAAYRDGSAPEQHCASAFRVDASARRR